MTNQWRLKSEKFKALYSNLWVLVIVIHKKKYKVHRAKELYLF
jgi:hypothetical protein